jgi:transcriptional regulator with XRE-family HTH domain
MAYIKKINGVFGRVDMKLEGIKKARVAAHMKLREVAEAMGVDIRTVQKWEAQETSPRLLDIRKLAKVLGVTEAELLNGPADNGELKFSFVMDIKEVESMDVRMNEFKVGTGDDDIFGLFRLPKGIDVEEAGRRFVNYLRAELAGDKIKRDELKKLEG